MIRQRTIKKDVTLEGIGLQTGKKVTITLKSSPPDSGINFIRTDLPNKPLLNIQSVNLDEAHKALQRTTLSLGPLQVQTTEHLLAALSALSIDNIVIETNGVELPGLDGSAKEFVSALKESGIAQQDAPKKFLKIEKPVWVSEGDRMLAVFPDDDFRISYTMSYENPSLGTQFFSINLDRDNFEKEVTPARTFCLKEEAAMLLKLGLGKGANYENTLVMAPDGPVNNKLRFADEPVRHKLLDLVGDLYILGMRLKGHVIAIKSGHELNMELVRKLKQIS